MRERPTVWNFTDALGGSWFVAMSGGLGVPLSVASVFIANNVVRTALYLTGIFCTVAASYSVWRQERLGGNRDVAAEQEKTEAERIRASAESARVDTERARADALQRRLDIRDRYSDLAARLTSGAALRQEIPQGNYEDWKIRADAWLNETAEFLKSNFGAAEATLFVHAANVNAAWVSGSLDERHNNARLYLGARVEVVRKILLNRSQE